ncbi:MAG: trypsin-like peptidase domain-containing protein [Actinomycetota bacterium]
MVNRYPPPYQAPPAPGQSPGEDRNVAGMMMPRTVVSLSMWIMMFGLGVGLAGVLMFIAYQGQMNSLEERLIDSQQELEKRLDEKVQELDARGVAPAPSESLNVSATSSEAVRAEIIRNAAPAVVGIQGIDASGRPTEGSGFVVNSTGEGAWIITNYSLVSGTGLDFRTVSVRMGAANITGQVFEVDPGADLALIVVNVASPRSMRFTRGDLKTGDTVWVVGAAKGNPFATALQARLVDYGPTRVIVGLDPAARFNGGPVLDSAGRVVGILSSRPPAPTGRGEATPAPASDSASRSATPARLACNLILRCPGSPRPETTPTPGGARPTPSPVPSPADEEQGQAAPEETLQRDEQAAQLPAEVETP